MKGYHRFYYVGYINGFGHEVVHIILPNKEKENKRIKQRVINRLIGLLQNIKNQRGGELMSFLALPTEVEAGVTAIGTELGTVFNVPNIVAVIAIILGITLGIAAFWFFGRMLVSKVMGAIRKGKVGV